MKGLYKMETMLLTGFDPFGGERINPAWEAVRCIPAVIGRYRIEKIQIPTVFSRAAEEVIRCAEVCHPAVILCVGQAGGRSGITPELIAINHRHASIPDNAGQQPLHETIQPDAPDAYFTTLPVYAMAETVQKAGIRASVSYTAGAFVCNDVFYSLMHRFHNTDTHVGFVHVPFLPEQDKNGACPSMPLDTIVQALEMMISVISINLL